MIVLPVMVFSVLLLAVGGSLYSRFLARQFGEDVARQTPALAKADGRDYVPSPTPVVFGHHFASIAGAGPILGPVLALCFGWGPALIWVLLGGLFIGGVHDYLAAYMSVRNDGQSVATIARRLLGRGPFVALMLFLVLMLGLVTATFLNTSATALTSMLDFGRMKLPHTQTMFRVAVDAAGNQKVVIGGIASMSVIVITALAPLVGWMYIKRRVPVWKCSLVAIAICGVSIVAGLYRPIAFPQVVAQLGSWTVAGTDIWKLLLSAYVLVAAGVPVWLFLQSRDFINVHILYAGVILLFVTLSVAALRAPAAAVGDAPLQFFDGATGTKYLGMFWPVLFITIACGAVSGFHSLCAGGTTAKQLKSEAAARYIGYWAMLLETLLAVAVILVMVVGTSKANYLADVFATGAQNPVLGFAFAVGNSARIAYGIPIAWGALAGMLLLEGFVITTLDTAVRLNRYLLEEIWQELFGRPVMRYYWVNSGLAVALMLGLSLSGSVLQLWQIFATANQLLAAFVLGIGSVWLLRSGKKVWYAVLPGLGMLATTVASLILLLGKYVPRTALGADGTLVPAGNMTLFVADIVLMVLTAFLVVSGVIATVRLLRPPKPQTSPAS